MITYLQNAGQGRISCFYASGFGDSRTFFIVIHNVSSSYD